MDGRLVLAEHGNRRIELGVATGNCAFGDDGSTLYITANTAIYRIRLSTKGVGF